VTVTIGRNISSLKAQRGLSESSNALERIFERLSSGQRINRASDDAAGLAVASGLNLNSRVFGQGIRNLNDGVSAISIADQAFASLSDIIVRQKELAEQSANGTFSDEQRVSLDTEAQALAQEYSRILQTTEFNGLTLLDGSLSTLHLQAGFGDDATLGLDLLALALNTNFTSDRYDADALTYAADGPPQLFLTDFNNDGLQDLIVMSSTVSYGSNQVNYSLSTLVQQADGTFTEADRVIVTGQAVPTVGGYQGSEIAVTPGSSTIEVRFRDRNPTATTDQYTFDSNGMLTQTLNDGGGIPSGQLANGQTSYSQDINGDGVVDTITAEVKSNLGIVRTSVSQQSMGAVSLEQGDFSLLTAQNALSALTSLTSDLNNLSSRRSILGASQSRVEVAIRVLGTSRENTIAAESRIVDADIAFESSNLVRQNILQQTSASILAQANTQPELALSLLRV
jgi:flagellin